MTRAVAGLALTAALTSGPAWAQEQAERKPEPHLWCERYDDDFYVSSCRFGGRVTVTKRDVQAQLRLVNYEGGEWSVEMQDLFVGPQILRDGTGGVVAGVAADANVFLVGLHAGLGAAARAKARPEVQMELGLRLLFVLEVGFRGVVGADVGRTGMWYAGISI